MSAELRRAMVMGRVREAAETYATADAPLTAGPGPADHRSGVVDVFFDDEYLWRALSSPRPPKIHILSAAVSEWVPRVPGLFWSPTGKRLREVTLPYNEMISERWRAHYPLGKSMRVSGGLGTIRLPAAPNGDRLVCLTTSLNASAGVLALFTRELWERTGLGEGSEIKGMAVWRGLDAQWAEYFPVLRGLPRGCLVFDQIERTGGDVPIQIHPFSLLDYVAGSAQLYDFVFATADTGIPTWRRDIADFFEGYRVAGNRAGQYLLAADAVDPLWDAEFATPAALRAATGPKAGLQLIAKRVEEAQQKQPVIDKLVGALAELEATRLRALAKDAGVAAARLSSGTPGAQALSLVDAAVEAGRLQALIDLTSLANPAAFGSRESRT